MLIISVTCGSLYMHIDEIFFSYTIPQMSIESEQNVFFGFKWIVANNQVLTKINTF